MYSSFFAEGEMKYRIGYLFPSLMIYWLTSADLPVFRIYKTKQTKTSTQNKKPATESKRKPQPP